MRALVIGGGGAKGAIALGVIDALRARGFDWDLYAGTSTGSIIAAMEAQEQHDVLLEMWLSLNGNGDIYKSGWLRNVIGYFKGGFYDFSPIHKLLRQHVHWDRVKHPLYVSMVSLATGDLVYASQYDGIPLADSVFTSCCFPPVAKPPVIRGSQHVDGGVREIVPLKVAVDAGADEIDVIACSPVDLEKTTKHFGSVLAVSNRALTIMGNEVLAGDLKQRIEYTRLINEMVVAGLRPGKREIPIRVYQPLRPNIIDTLEFDPRKIREMLAHGREAGRGAWS
ncbi:MAG: patatin-like phospholipase family protein [Candidatus Zixiibacteriota bacterium]